MILNGTEMETLDNISDLLDNFNFDDMLNHMGRRNSLEDMLNGFGMCK